MWYNSCAVFRTSVNKQIKMNTFTTSLAMLCGSHLKKKNNNTKKMSLFVLDELHFSYRKGKELLLPFDTVMIRKDTHIESTSLFYMSTIILFIAFVWV